MGTTYFSPYHSAKHISTVRALAPPRPPHRLERQYTMMKRVFGRTSPVPPTVDLSRLPTVLDVGAGTCAWTLDLARQSEIQPRLAGASPAVRLHACDLSLAKFPPRQATDALGITVFEQDATQAFPAALLGTCDLVHASLLVGALTADGWRAALGSYWDLLSESARVHVRML